MIVPWNKVMMYVFNPDKTLTFYLYKGDRDEVAPILVKRAQRDVNFIRRRSGLGTFYNKRIPTKRIVLMEEANEYC
jgi:hypothetical protein